METSESNEETVEVPALKCELNSLSRADGSCILGQNNTVMAVAVYGPVEVKHHKLLIDKAYIDVVYRPKCGVSQIGDRLRESIIGKICESAILTNYYPRTAICVIVQEMQNCGMALACSLNATCLALIHSGLPMNYLFAAVTNTVISDEAITLDSEEKTIKPTITFVFENSSEKILAVESFGKISDEQYQKCLKNCRTVSKSIFQFYKDMISKYATII